MFKNSGIIGKGLRGGPAGAILGRFSLGGFSVEVEVIEGTDPEPARNGGGLPWKRRRSKPEIIYDTIKITMRHGDVVFMRTIKVPQHRTPVIIKLINTVTRVTTNISARITKVASTLKKIRIK